MVVTYIEELVELPASMLDDVLGATELERRRIEARLASITAVAEQKAQFLADGHRSMSGYLKAHLNCSGVEANRLRRLAKLVDERPEAGDALEAGYVSVSNIDLIARAWSAPRGHDQIAACLPLLLAHAEQFSTKDFAVLVDRTIANADPDGTEPNDDHGANATVVAGPDGLHASITGGTGLQAAEMKAVFDLAVEAEFMNDVAARRAEFGDHADQHPLPRTAAQRRFAAEYAIHMAYVSTPADAQRPEPLVNIVFTAGYAAETMADHGLVPDADVFGPEVMGDRDAEPTHATCTSAGNERAVEDPADLTARRCETSTGVQTHPHEALRSMIRGRVRRVVLDPMGVVIDLGPSRRCFTGKARTAAQLIVLSCSHPGCDIPAEFCDVDHLRRHADGGPTSQHNAGPECRSHNLFKETAGLRSRRAANGRVYLIRPDGSVIMPVGARQPRWADGDPPRPTDGDEAKSDLEAHDSVIRALLGDTETMTWAEFLERGAATRRIGVVPIVRLTVDDLSPRTAD